MIIGSFYVDLNELTKIGNPLLKSDSEGELYSHDGYYTMLDAKSDKVTNDRLGLKIMMLKESDVQLDHLSSMFHSIPHLTHLIEIEHDISLKGSIDLNELRSLIESETEGEA